MHPRAGDRSDVDDGTSGRFEFIDQSARQHDRGEEIHLEHVLPYVERGRDRAEPRAPLSLRRDAGIVDQRVQLAVDPPLDLGDCGLRVGRVGQVHLDMILRAGLPGAVFRKRMARAGDHPPARGREALDRGVSDAAACSGEQQRAARLV